MMMQECMALGCHVRVTPIAIFCEAHLQQLTAEERTELAELRENHPDSDRLRVRVAQAMASLGRKDGKL